MIRKSLCPVHHPTLVLVSHGGLPSVYREVPRLGGRSVMDTAKAVCMILKNGINADDHAALIRLTEPQIPHIAFPTTSGTGSEVTNVSAIKSQAAGRRIYIVDNYITPNRPFHGPHRGHAGKRCPQGDLRNRADCGHAV